jgi:uncharacterized membrane protein YtjA (UPF0391 family)
MAGSNVFFSFPANHSSVRSDEVGGWVIIAGPLLGLSLFDSISRRCRTNLKTSCEHCKRFQIIGGKNMLHYAIVFLVVAIIAAIFGFTGIAGTSAWIAHVLFVLFLVLFVISLIFRGRPSV